jgi:hypothetical protein
MHVNGREAGGEPQNVAQAPLAATDEVKAGAAHRR